MGKSRTVKGGGRYRRAGLCAAAAGAAGQADLGTSEISGRAVLSEPAAADSGPPPASGPGRSPSHRRRSPMGAAPLTDSTVPPAPAFPLVPAQSPRRGRAVGQAGKGREAAPAASAAPLLPLHLERKINLRAIKLPSFALTHPGALLHLTSPGRCISPHTPRWGGNPLDSGRSRENISPGAPVPFGGPGRGGSCPGCAGHRGPPDGL